MGSQQQSAMVRSVLAGTILFLLVLLFFSNFVWLFGTEVAITRVVLGFAITTACLVVGFTLALVLFLNVDDDMKGIKTLVVGALSGTTLIKAESILGTLKYRYHQAFTQGDGSSLSLIFFLGFSTALLGFVSGFFWVRLGGLAKEVAKANSEVQTILAKVPLIPTLPWPEFREEFISAPEKLPDEKELNRLANIVDWSSVPPSEMIRAGAALLAKKRPEEALKPTPFKVDGRWFFQKVNQGRNGEPRRPGTLSGHSHPMERPSMDALGSSGLFGVSVSSQLRRASLL